MRNNNNYELVYTTGEPKEVKPSAEEIKAQREERYYDLVSDCIRYGVEYGHYEADCLVVGLLRELGYGKVADAFETLPKWYA